MLKHSVPLASVPSLASNLGLISIVASLGKLMLVLYSVYTVHLTGTYFHSEQYETTFEKKMHSNSRVKSAIEL